MSNNYVINALWTAAESAVGRRDMDALKDIVKAIDGYGLPQTGQVELTIQSLDVVAERSRSMPYLSVLKELDKFDSFNKFFQANGEHCFSILDFLHWVNRQPSISWMTATPNFSKQLYNVFYRAVNKRAPVNDHPYLKDVIKGVERGSYYYNPMPLQVVKPLFA